MKKLFAFMLCALLLCACSTKSSQDTLPTDAVTMGAATATTEATETMPQQTELSPKELAMTCLDLSVEELYALIGEPESSEYGPSCLGDGEDGNLYYDGFVVYTYRDDSGEIVQFVE